MGTMLRLTTKRSVLVTGFLLAGCSNELPPPGECVATVASGDPVVTSVPLIHGSAGFDDLRYSVDLQKVIAAPEGTGKVFLVDPETLELTPLTVPRGVGSADAKGRMVYVLDRGNDKVVAVDADTGMTVSQLQLAGSVDYLTASPTTDEVWVTRPGDGRIDIVGISGSPVVLSNLASISLDGGPEGLTFDGAGHAYTQGSGDLIVIDVAKRAVTGSYPDGCGRVHGFPYGDPQLGLGFGGCGSNGGVGVVSTTTGDKRAGFEAGGGPALLAYNPLLRHLYVRGDGAPSLEILGVCADGTVSPMASVAIPSEGHGVAADDRGHAWACDSAAGAIVRIADPFAASK